MLTKISNPTGTAATLILSHIKNSCLILSQEHEKCGFDYHIWKNSDFNGESLYKNGHDFVDMQHAITKALETNPIHEIILIFL